MKQRADEYLRIHQKQLPFPQAPLEDSGHRPARGEFKDEDPQDPLDFKPKGRQLFQSQISIGTNKKEGSAVKNTDKIGNFDEVSVSS